MLQNAPVALLATVCRFRVKRGFESSIRPRQRTPEALDTKVFEWGGGVLGK